jgi:hypothetical protein
MYDSLLSRPNYPSPPQRSFNINTFPNDLTTTNNTRNYYTEISFYDYNSSTLGDLIIKGEIGAAAGALAGGLFEGLLEFLRRRGTPGPRRPGDLAVAFGQGFLGGAGLGFGAMLGNAAEARDTIVKNNGNIIQGYNPASKGTIKLPIPQRINDSLSFSWGEGSLKEIAGQLASASTITSNRRYIGGQIIKYGAELYGVATGYAINPLFYQAFQNPNFRTFQFNWLLAPRTKTESVTISKIISMMKQAASPSLDGTLGGVVIKYPMIAMIKFFPNDLNRSVVLKPCIIQGISVDYTASGSPSFFAGGEGAPTIVSIGLSVKELQLWYREDFVKLENRI